MQSPIRATLRIFWLLLRCSLDSAEYRVNSIYWICQLTKIAQTVYFIVIEIVVHKIISAR